MSTLLDRIAPFKGPLTMAFIHNWLLTAHRLMFGPKFGITVDAAHQPTGLDLDLLKEYGLIEVKSVGIIGRQGYGKTFLMNTLLFLLSCIDVGGIKPFSIMINSLKRNKMARPETAPLVTDLLGSQVIDPHSAHLNPLSRKIGMTFNEQVTLLTQLIQLRLTVEKFTTPMLAVLKHVLRLARANPHVDPSFPVLQDLLRAYVPEGLEHKGGFPAGVTNGHHATPDLLARNPEVFEEAALQLYLALDAYKDGEFLGMFTGDSSEIVKLLEQRAVSFDLKALTPMARSALEIVLSAVMTSAMMPEDDDPELKPKHPERVPHAEGIDEAWSEWGNPVVAGTLYNKSKTKREQGRTTISCFHRLRDLQDAIPDPQAQKMAANAINEIEVWFIFRQGSKQDVDSLKEFFGNRLPDHVTGTLRTLKKGFCWMIIPGESPVLIMVMGTPTTVGAFVTEGAHRELLERWYRTGNAKYYSQYLTATTPKDDEESDTIEEETDAMASA